MLAYIDPGILTVAVQGLFALLFAAMTGYVLAPWRWVKSLFGAKPAEHSASADASNEPVRAPSSKVDGTGSGEG